MVSLKRSSQIVGEKWMKMWMHINKTVINPSFCSHKRILGKRNEGLFKNEVCKLSTQH